MTRNALAATLAAALVLPAFTVAADAQDGPWLTSLVTETPQEGFDLAVTMARMAVKTAQPDVSTLGELRPAYASDPESLIGVSGVVAAYFDTIAEANDYWRD